MFGPRRRNLDEKVNGGLPTHWMNGHSVVTADVLGGFFVADQ